ncbi:MAG: tRNA lysidine(34) synthetase TilS [Thermodesulfobacteriota bacterium]
MTPFPSNSTDNLLQTVLRAISRFSMLTSGDRVLVAVSGGPDSVALLHLLLRIAPEYSLSLGVAHLNHGLRGRASDRDAEFTAALARDHDLPFYAGRRNVDALRRAEGLSPEEAARKARHGFLAEIRRTEGYRRLALGHHADDNAELVLMRLIQGGGPAGTAGMAPVRDDGVVRPLIQARRTDIEAFLRAEGIGWVADESNADPRFLRNRIRSRLIPLLREEFNPAIVDALNRYAEIRREEETWLSGLTRELAESCTLRPIKAGSDAEAETDGRVLSVPCLRTLPIALRRRVVRRTLEVVRGHLRRITLDHLNGVLALVDGDGRHRRLDLPGRVRVVRTGEEMRIRRLAVPLRNAGASAPAFAYEMEGPGVLALPEIDARLSLSIIPRPSDRAVRHAGQHVAFFDMKKVRFPLVVRNARPGDRFTPLGMSGSQSVSDFLINRKIPLPDRPRCPVLLSGNRIIWVAGGRIDDAVKLTHSAESVLKAEIFLV